MIYPLRYLCLLLGLITSISGHAGQLVKQHIYSESLAREYKYAVYLPSGYQNSEQRYPVLYLLHGAGGSETDWMYQGGIKETMDALIIRQDIQGMIVIMPADPDGWWVDGAVEKAETALLKDLMPAVESHYRIALEGKRLIAGLSAGGYGALNLMMKHPDLFAAAAIFSPAIYDPLPPPHSSAMTMAQFQLEGKFSESLWRSLNYVGHIESYKKSGLIVPLYINSGDHDTYGIALQAAILYEKLRLHQPQKIELRIVDGDHEWMLWRDSVADGLRYMNRFVDGY